MFQNRLFYITLWAGLLTLLLSHSGYSHTSLDNFIQHNLSLKINPTNIDIEIQLTFYSLRSLPIRQQIDADQNSVISKTEIQNYLKINENSFSDELTLWVDDREVPLVSRYSPDLDLLEMETVGPFPHALRLYYFARTPDWIHSGSTITFADRLWSELPAIRYLHASGEQGIHTELLSDSTNISASNPNSTAQRWTLRCSSLLTENAPPSLNPPNPLSDPVVIKMMRENKAGNYKYIFFTGIGLFILLGIGYERLKRYFRHSEL